MKKLLLSALLLTSTSVFAASPTMLTLKVDQPSLQPVGPHYFTDATFPAPKEMRWSSSTTVKVKGKAQCTTTSSFKCKASNVGEKTLLLHVTLTRARLLAGDKYSTYDTTEVLTKLKYGQPLDVGGAKVTISKPNLASR